MLTRIIINCYVVNVLLHLAKKKGDVESMNNFLLRLRPVIGPLYYTALELNKLFTYIYTPIPLFPEREEVMY